MIKLESIINFSPGQTVMFNPDSHGFKLIGHYENSKNLKGKVKKVNEIERTISVCFKRNAQARKFNYQRFIII